MSVVNKEPYITPEMISKWNAGGGWTKIKTYTKRKADFTLDIQSGDSKRCMFYETDTSLVNAIKNAKLVKFIGYWASGTSAGANAQEFGETEFSYQTLATYCPNGAKIASVSYSLFLPTPNEWYYLAATVYIEDAELTLYFDESLRRYNGMDSSTGAFVLEVYVC